MSREGLAQEVQVHATNATPNNVVKPRWDKRTMWPFKPNRQKMHNMRDRRDVKGLARALRSRDLSVRTLAAKILANLDVAATVGPLVTALREDEDYRVRRWAAWGLAKSGDVRAFEPLMGVAQDSDSDVRSSAVWGLGRLRDTRAFATVVRALRDREKAVCCSAARASGELGDERAVKPLLRALRDHSSSELRRAAAEALGTLKSALAVDPLVSALADSSDEVRTAAVKALATLGDPRAVKPLKRLLASLESRSLLHDMRIDAMMGKVGPGMAHLNLASAAETALEMLSRDESFEEDDKGAPNIVLEEAGASARESIRDALSEAADGLRHKELRAVARRDGVPRSTLNHALKRMMEDGEIEHREGRYYLPKKRDGGAVDDVG